MLDTHVLYARFQVTMRVGVLITEHNQIATAANGEIHMVHDSMSNRLASSSLLVVSSNGTSSAVDGNSRISWLAVAKQRLQQGCNRLPTLAPVPIWRLGSITSFPIQHRSTSSPAAKAKFASLRFRYLVQ